MRIKKITTATIKLLLPVLLGGVILYWMYRDFDFKRIESVMLYDMDWTWMLLSLPFGITAQLFRGIRWRQTLEPVGERPRLSTCVNSIFLSYAASLVIPRIGEFTRCGVLGRCDGVSFPKALGTVVTERAIDTLLVMLITGLTLLAQMRIFGSFFQSTGTSLDSILRNFSATGYIVTAVCAVAILVLLHFLLKRLAIYNKVRATLSGIWQGMISLRSVKNIPLFIILTLGIWGSYFLHYYLTFFCFEFTSGLGLMCGLATFVVGSIAVIVPTPNGAGPWHFAVKTMLLIYGATAISGRRITADEALSFVLIVHTIQTMLVVLLGVAAWIMIGLKEKRITNS
ncbi:lysylphosphatidylglycerol synthase transmembrane domain-containing protein [uncultured Prevotella sp.]|uniref:lysylphosphatidylglycerol synthase transmembrane domain-containing protein n=1 Tax=uncultured Prevotella sp. TaxID=159272 RepID=UPI0026166C24|nr:lysylphosphatidylglycerol synthase transmembrane domain-containing protein [uncultured Prevotella sp.]